MSTSFIQKENSFSDVIAGQIERSFTMSVNNQQEYRTAESVSPRHPDKICDQISDAILDAHLSEDPGARVAVDVAGGHGVLFVTGEVTSKAQRVNIADIVNRIAGDIELIENIARQSPEIAKGVDIGGAGDQGIMVGYATNETPEYLPLEVVLSRKLNQYLFSIWPFDGKTQVTVCGGEITHVVASFQHAPSDKLEQSVANWLKDYSVAASVVIYANPAGDWNIGGFDADAGLTGRKLAIDNYGPRIPVGGGAFSGKDPSKVDRSGAYIARKIAIDYLKERKAREVYVRIAYAIGVVDPLEATVVVDGCAEQVVGYDLTPNGIITSLGLRRPLYEQTARYGHFGHGFDWER
ncbi:MAG TPA: methionine adenosyltransferase domain-containing protein [Candidatus Saccharimonadales bacterium]|nr:methionine adenosyltransferase domain-containing protein [Candidatus Saccharimonadales bacterium]